MKLKDQAQINLNLLLSGKHPQAKKYAGKHVMVIENEVVTLEKGEAGLDFKKLKEKYGQPSVLTFVPRQYITYIL